MFSIENLKNKREQKKQAKEDQIKSLNEIIKQLEERLELIEDPLDKDRLEAQRFLDIKKRELEKLEK